MSIIHNERSQSKQKSLFVKIIRLISNLDDLYNIGEYIFQRHDRYLKLKLIHQDDERIDLLIDFYDERSIVANKQLIRLYPNSRKAEIIG